MSQYNTIAFQQTAIDKLTESFKRLWETGRQTNNFAPREIVFKSPTGSGKTFMVTHFIDNLNRQPDWQEDVAFVWVTFSDDLAMQSKTKFYEYFFPNLSNNLLTISDLNQGILKRNDILFLNWQKLVSKKAADRVLRRPETVELHKESGFYFEDVVENTHADKREIVMIIDESHKNVTESAVRDVINPLNPRIILKVSATPEREPSQEDKDANKAAFVYVNREDVVEAGLIKREVITQTEDDLNIYSQQDHDTLLLDLAMEKRSLIAAEWRKLGKEINPLVLIQLPDDEKRLKDTDVRMKDTIVTQYLLSKGVTADKIAYWFDNRRENMDNIIEPNNKVEYMLFKYAAGTGWDCPRAHILVMYREIQSNTFKTQTIGRILRNPAVGSSLNDYPLLYTGYLFTNYQRNEVQAPVGRGDYMPKTIVSSISTQAKIEFSSVQLGNELTEKINQHLSNATSKTKEVAKAVLNAVETSKQIANEISIIANNEQDELKKIHSIEQKKIELNQQIQSEIGNLFEDDKEKQIVAEHIQSQIQNLAAVVTQDKDTQFVLDPCLISDYISKIHSGDLGQATSLQRSLRKSFNTFFGVTGDEDSTEKQRNLLRNRGIDPTPILEQDVLVNARFKSEVDDSMNDMGKNIKFEMSDNDVEKEFTLYCYDILAEQNGETKINNVARAWGPFKEAIRQWYKNTIETYLDIEFYKVFLKDIHKGSNSIFRQAIAQALLDYKPILEEYHQKQKENAERQYAVPFSIKTRYAYNENAKEYEPSALSIVKPFRLPEVYNGRQNETEFIVFLEQQYERLEWWFKNGDSGQDYLGIKYFDSATQKDRLFYPDWILKFKDGRIGLFDTKGGITAASQETADKANALQKRIAYLNSVSNLYTYFGGIIVKTNGIWYYNDSADYHYSPNDMTSWIAL